jgi:glycolate oxidase FAD binding subunit
LTLPAATEPLPIKTTHSPAEQAEVATIIATAYAAETPLYPIGGGTSLQAGLPAKSPGEGLSLAKLNRIIDYPARDLTATVEAGVTMRALAELLATERQRLPVDVPQASQATVGGVIATNANGPRRYGLGSLRDFVIGISAIDGRGAPFQGGGRVVKNVAGYDFCKLLTGSLGTLGVITQVTFKLSPIPEHSQLLAGCVSGAEHAEELLVALANSATTPTAIELLAGPTWDNDPAFATFDHASPARMYVVVEFEGLESEVEWMTKQLGTEWRQAGFAPPQVIGDRTDLWRRLVEFPAIDAAPLAIKAALVPSGVAPFIAAVRQVDPEASIQAHAGNGIVLAKFAQYPEQGLSRALVGNLHPVAARYHGQVTVVSNPSAAEMTHQSVWGGIDAPFALMTAVKQKFDPRDILNRGRFVYV